MATTATVAVTAVGPPATAAAHASDEEIAKKKSTDCVYFLASPLTCKKGDECEFRHSESARLNPRDCWYWVGGNCRNRECPFRHPPIESRPAAAPPPTPPVQKKPVPCFFFSQGCCAKGNKCQFLHENPASNAMVYRLSNSSKAATEDSSKIKPDNSIPDAAQHHQPAQTSDKKKDNVYRLQDDPKKGKPAAAAAAPPPASAAAAAAAAAGPSRESSEDLNDTRNRAGKPHKDSFTWKLSDSPAAQKQPATTETVRKPEKHSRKSSSSSGGSEPDKKRREPVASRGSSDRVEEAEMVVAEDFAGPKSLAQIKEEKRSKSDDSDEPSSGSKAKRKGDAAAQGGGGGDRVRRKLCNGTGIGGDGGGDGDAGGVAGDADGGGMETNGGDAAAMHADEDDDEAFARKLAGLL